MRSVHHVAAAVLVLAVLSSAPSALELDLVSGEFEGRPLNSYTLDEFTELLGRPSEVRSPQEVYGIRLGAQLKFHDIGLEAWFEHPKSDAEKHCRELTAYLIATPDEESDSEYAPFPGIITQGFTADWKADAVLELLGPLGATDIFDQESYDRMAELVAAKIEAGLAELDEEPECGLCSIILENEVFAADIDYEYNTRFIESAQLVYLVGPSSVRGGFEPPPLPGDLPGSPERLDGALATHGLSASNVTFSSAVGGFIDVIGEISNDSAPSYSSALFTISVYDEKERLLGVGHAVLGELRRGQTKSFSTAIDARYDEMRKYKLQFEGGY